MKIDWPERIRRGAALLDEARPDWRDVLANNHINTSTSDRDVLGLLWYTTEDGMDHLGIAEYTTDEDGYAYVDLRDDDVTMHNNWATLYHYGFHNYDPDTDTHTCTDDEFERLWHQIARQQSVKLPDTL